MLFRSLKKIYLFHTKSMDTQIYILLLLLISSLQLIKARTITTTDLHQALFEAKPGDIIELKSGFYRNHSYELINGTFSRPIKIKSAPNAQVYFIGQPDKCVFDTQHIQHVTFEGPMVLQDALCGFKFMESSYIKIINVSIYDMRQQAILISGFSNVITENVIQGCVLENKVDAKRKRSGWNQCLAIWGATNRGFSSHITISQNKISNSYGEAVYFLNCKYCNVTGNNITNGLSANIYIDSSKDIQITKNVLRVNSTEYDNKNGKACGIALSSDNYHYLERINIENNIIIGTRIGIYYFPQYSGSTYNEVKIYFNTLWNVDYTPILFKRPKNLTTFENEMKNNFIDFAGAVEFEPKSSWKFDTNYFYNTSSVPSIYYEPFDTHSRAEKNETLDSIFNKIKGCENYYDPNIKPECFRPSPHPGIIKLYRSGNNIGFRTYNDFYSCTRHSLSPSIGAYEFFQECSELIPPKNNTRKEYSARINITYCTSGFRILKMITLYTQWTMAKHNKCNWTMLFVGINHLKFKFKFAETVESTIYKIESDPFRTFDGDYLYELVTENANGTYNDCQYTTSGNLITLVCSWR